MALDLGNIFGSFGLGSFNFSTIIDKVYFFAGVFLLCLMVGGIIAAFFYFKSKKNRIKDLVKIGWWEDTIAGMVPTRMDDAEEIIIPGTSLRVFYVKDRDLWLPRFTRGITKDLFYVALTPTRQMVNFTLKSLGDSLKDTDLEFDHTDMLWAAENTREFIKRNYKDKSIKWWQAYQGVITTAIYILIMTFSLVLIIYFLKGLVDEIRGLVAVASEAAAKSCANAFNSGVVAA
jgi:hypothetical protein